MQLKYTILRERGVSVTMTIRKDHSPQPSITEGTCGSTKFVLIVHLISSLVAVRKKERKEILQKTGENFGIVTYLRLTFLRV